MTLSPNARQPQAVLPLSYSYFKAAGNVFLPVASTTTFNSSGLGCMYATGGSNLRFQLPLNLPDGADLKYVRIYYVDTSPSDVNVVLSKVEPGLTNLSIVGVQSTGAGGYGTTLSKQIGGPSAGDPPSETVDNYQYSYVLTFIPGIATSASQICGVRVAYYAPPGVGGFTPVDPCRLADTRGNGFTGAYGPPFMPGGAPRDFPIAGQCGIPFDARAVSFNFTVTNTAGPGFLLAYPQGGTQPTVSTLNYALNQTVANAAIVPLASSGGITVIPGVSGSNLIIDVNGYFK